MTKKAYWLIIILFFLLVICISFEADPMVARRIGPILGVEGNWMDVERAFYEGFKPGMSKEEVYKYLNKIGEFKIDFTDGKNEGDYSEKYNKIVFREQITFLDVKLQKGLGDYIMFYFDADNKLVIAQKLHAHP